MRMNQISVILSFLMMSLSLGPDAAKAAQTQRVVDGNTGFALDLYQQLKSSRGNLFFSPYSISSALAMTYDGVRGNTEKQMAQALHFPGDHQELNGAFGALQSQLNAAGKKAEIQINIANALWAQKGHPFLPPFLNTAKGEYQANVNQADFMAAAESARNEINQWVAQQTREKIHDLLPPGSIDGATRLVLANAVYFKGLWATPFEKAGTSQQVFHVTGTHQVGAPLMHHFARVGYFEDQQMQAIEMPYKEDELSMVVLLPREIEGGASLETRLSPGLLSSCLKGMRKQNVEIFLPRFKLESTFGLAGALAKMGMRDAFGQNADFSGMDGTRNLCISAIYHKAWGEVNEEGTEAAAATGVLVAISAAVTKPPPPPPVFRADHPFLFLIRHTRSGSVLFLGRLANPAD